MKKALTLIVAALLLIGLTGCSDNGDTEVVSNLEYIRLEKYDVRELTWGMSIEQVAAQERNCTVAKSEKGGYVARDVEFGGHIWTVIYEFDTEGLIELCYMYYGDEAISEVYSDMQEYLNTQLGVGVEDEKSSGKSTLWKSDSCDIELYSDYGDSGSLVCVTYAPLGTFEYKFDISHKNNAEAVTTQKQFNLTVPFGEVLDVNETGDILVIKTKITPSFSNHATISQNFQNLEDLIVNQGCSKYNEIQYWAVADMSDGSESKVVAFTAPKSTIDGIKDGSISVISYLDEYGYLDDVYILPSLKD